MKGVHLLAEAMFFGEETEELAAGTVLEGEEEFFLILEGVVEFDDKGVIHADEDVAFGHDVGLLFAFFDIFFFEYFHGVDSVVVFAFFFDKDNFSVGTFADD